MRKTFEQSAETERLVALFSGLGYAQNVSFEEASKAVGFTVYSTMPAYQSAKRIAKREHGVFIVSVRGVGFARGTGSDMVAAGPSVFKSIKSKALNVSALMLMAVNENLTEDEHRSANEMYARAGVIAATSSSVRPSSNAPRRAAQPVSLVPINNPVALRTIRSKKAG